MAPHTEILHKWSHRIGPSGTWNGSWCRWSNRSLIQRSCTSGPTGSWYVWSKRILTHRSSYRDLPQVVLQDPNTSGPKKWSYCILKRILDPDTTGPKGSWYMKVPDTEILYKWSVLYKWSKRILIQRSCTGGPILIQGSWNRGLAQVVLQNPDKSGRRRSSYRDPGTEILHKWSHRILVQWSKRIVIQWSRKILIRRFCASGPTGSWDKCSKRILIQRSCDRDLHKCYYSDTEILHKSSYKILISGPKGSSYRDLAQVVWQDPDSGRIWLKRILKQRTGPKGCYKWSKRILNREIQVIQKESEAEILHKRCYKILIQVVRKDPQRSLNRSCTSAPTGSV